MTIDELLGQGSERLTAAGLTGARAESALLLGALLDLDRLALYARGDQKVPAEIADEFHRRIERRAAGEPAAYILGFRDFYEHRFRVTPDVLIPRPETERLVDFALEAGLPEPARVLDLCCGSGCVGISIQAARPDWQVVCSDLSPAALAVARANARAICGAEASAADRPVFFQGDLFAALAAAPETVAPDPDLGGAFHAILCNPPYIHPDEAADLDPGLAFEPGLALFHADPLELGRRILRDALDWLAPGGHLALETGPRWTADLLALARELYAVARIETDPGGLERFLIARRS